MRTRVVHDRRQRRLAIVEMVSITVKQRLRIVDLVLLNP